ncbi:hypothetical protein MTO96_015863 [Rhipicephalus appendiculatus]
MRVWLFTFVTYFSSIHPDGKAWGCRMKPREGDDCEPDITKWYYNTEEGECQNFMYGECESPDNTFDSQQKCKETCKGGVKRPPKRPPPSERPPVPEPGPRPP